MAMTKECLLNEALTLKDEQNLWSQRYSQRLCHSQHNVKLSINYHVCQAT
jgi:hypothetical protein